MPNSKIHSIWHAVGPKEWPTPPTIMSFSPGVKGVVTRRLRQELSRRTSSAVSSMQNEPPEARLGVDVCCNCMESGRSVLLRTKSSDLELQLQDRIRILSGFYSRDVQDGTKVMTISPWSEVFFVPVSNLTLGLNEE